VLSAAERKQRRAQQGDGLEAEGGGGEGGCALQKATQCGVDGAKRFARASTRVVGGTTVGC